MFKQMEYMNMNVHSLSLSLSLSLFTLTRLALKCTFLALFFQLVYWVTLRLHRSYSIDFKYLYDLIQYQDMKIIITITNNKNIDYLWIIVSFPTQRHRDG